jgi:hypothetical protein
MIGICIELKTECKHCGNPLMINALVENILCPACHKTNSFSVEAWHGLLDDGLEGIEAFKPGEGQPSSIFSGEYKYNMLFGRQEPRCRNCKQDIDVSKIEEYAQSGTVKCVKCSTNISVRKAPENVQKEIAGIKYLIGEDSDLISTHTGDKKLPNDTKPILFTCPSCAGNLEIDGSSRIINCKFCDSQIYLPDDLWLRMHPAEEVQRWYMMYDKVAAAVDKLLEWYYIPGFVIDKDGNCYVASGLSDSSS